MFARVAFVTLIALSILCAAGGRGTSAMLAGRQDTTADLAAMCPARNGSTVAQSRPGFLAPVSEGIDIGLLAAHPAQQLPPGTEFALSIVRVSLVGDVETKRRRTVGPLLFLVEGGSLEVSVNGRLQQLGPGESVLVEMNRLFTLRHAGSEPAHALLLGVLLSEGRLLIGPQGTPAIWHPAPEEADAVFPRQLFVGEVGPLTREETLLFMACLRWTDAAAEVAAASYPGPVGALVLHGESVVNEADWIDAGGCSLYPAFAPVRLEAGDQPPVLIFFGALRASAPTLASQGEAADGAMAESRGIPCTGPEAGGDG